MSNENQNTNHLMIIATILLIVGVLIFKSFNPTPKSDSYALHLREQHLKVWAKETRVVVKDEKDDKGMCAGKSFISAGNVDLVGSCGPRLNLIKVGGFSYGN